MASAITPIMLIGQQSLRVKAKPIATDVQTLWASMVRLVNTMTQNGTITNLGNGLSGPQIGQNEQTFITIDPTDLTWRFYANPVIKVPGTGNGVVPTSPPDANTWNTASIEGCLSIPDSCMGPQTPYVISRLKNYSVQYYTLCDASGNTLPTAGFTSPLPATAPAGTTVKQLTVPISYNATTTDPKVNELNWVIQHEVDHLNGVLFTDYANLTSPYGTNDLATDLFNRAKNLWPPAYVVSANAGIANSPAASPDKLPLPQQQLIYGS